MQIKKYLERDALAALNGYVAPPTKEDRGSCLCCSLPQDLSTVSDRLFQGRSGRTRLRDPYGRENIFTEACLIL